MESTPSTDCPRFGTYLLLGELGHGGQGTVWLAEDTKLHRKVALKLLTRGPGSIAPDKLRRFRREAAAVARLDDPHICALLDAGDVDGVPYLAFRHVEGATLATRIAGAGGPSASASTRAAVPGTNGSAGAGTIRIWDLRTGTALEQRNHELWVNRCQYSPDGRFLASASDDNTVRLWSTQDYRLLQVFRCVEQANFAIFSPDGRYLYMNDGTDLARHRITVEERIEDPDKLLRQAERAAGMQLQGLELVPIR